MQSKYLLIFFYLFFSFLKTITIFADQRIWIKNAELNNKPVKLCFDSDAENNGICLQLAKRLGLKLNFFQTNNLSSEIVVGDTSAYLNINENRSMIELAILNFPYYVNADFDGIVAWSTLKENTLQIDASELKLNFLPRVPKQVTNWSRFFVATNSKTLVLEIPNNQGAKRTISIDTGSDWGFALPPSQWQQWKKLHAGSPITLKTYYAPMYGFLVTEEAWADQIRIGPLVLTNVPIIEEPAASMAFEDNNHEGTLGLAALKHLNLIIDGEHSIAYLQPNNRNSLAYSHNHLGAVFVPAVGHPQEGVAIVENGSPAYEAGVRNGDILLAVDGIAVTGWSDKWLSRFILPGGTKLNLTLQRNDVKFETIATLREIIPPESPKHN